MYLPRPTLNPYTSVVMLDMNLYAESLLCPQGERENGVDMATTVFLSLIKRKIICHLPVLICATIELIREQLQLNSISMPPL